MEKIGFNAEMDEALRRLISERLIRYSCQFFERKNKEIKPYGSGVFAEIGGSHYIFTASHVAKGILKEESEILLRVGQKKYVNIIGDIVLTEIEQSNGIDMAYIKISEELISPLKRPYYFLTIDKIRKHDNLLDGTNYCVIGFPENNVRFDKGYFDTGATAYFTKLSKDKVYKYYNYEKKDCYVLNIEGKGTDIKSGERGIANTHFYGLSGCGLWYYTLIFDIETKKYEYDYRLIGIMTEYKKGKYFCFVGNKIINILNALKKREGLKLNEKEVKN